MSNVFRNTINETSERTRIAEYTNMVKCHARNLKLVLHGGMKNGTELIVCDSGTRGKSRYNDGVI